MDRYTPQRTVRTFPQNVTRYLRPAMSVCLLLACMSSVGCVDRTVKINSEPSGALVYLNDQEVGRSPVKVNFTWYGDYDIIIRHKGYKTLKTNQRIDAPWYQWPGIDLVSECLIPTTIHDDRDLGTFTLEKLEKPTKEALIRNAEEMRSRAIGETTPATVE
ncbi:MAG TPA: PEGA domain-containing protein [Phycisphaerae bacterium]|nr:PEGA domain-containing protein [Phycisphaerae bacterium]